MLAALTVTVLAAGAGVGVAALMGAFASGPPEITGTPFRGTPAFSGKSHVPPKAAVAARKLDHVVIIMQENRSFDTYFGTYPGADGIPMRHGKPAVCLPNPNTERCVRPFHDPSDVNVGGPHGADEALADIDGGKMDGFVRSAFVKETSGCVRVPAHDCIPDRERPDVMGYKTRADIPNYWAYADHFVLQDRMFSSVAGPSLPNHLYLVSGWSARCKDPDDPMSCITENNDTDKLDPDRPRTNYDMPWTDLTYLFGKAGITWRYFVSEGYESDCDNLPRRCVMREPGPGTPMLWNPLPEFKTVHKAGRLDQIQTMPHFWDSLRSGRLPDVTWIVPSEPESEHPAARVSVGQAFVTNIVNHIMRSSLWRDTAIFVTWDEWGGFYDHVVPPVIDGQRVGVRVPGLVISPYAKGGYIDSRTATFDSYVKFIEDLFLQGRRLDPTRDGRPDSRPAVRDNAPQLSDLLDDFDFSHPPRPPYRLPIYPKTPHPRAVSSRGS